MTPEQVTQLLRPLTIKDLRVQARARGLSPAGGMEQLGDRLKEAMLSSGDFSLKNEDGSNMETANVVAGASTNEQVAGNLKNNYVRSAGQNVGNFLTDRNSSRVLAPPGGSSQIVFGDYKEPTQQKAGSAAAPAVPSTVSSMNEIGENKASGGHSNNNYGRPGGQNVGNFLTDRNSSRVLAPPGGSSQIIFG